MDFHSFDDIIGHLLMFFPQILAYDCGNSDMILSSFFVIYYNLQLAVPAL